MLARFRKMTSRKSDEGASAVEYGLLVAAIAAAIALAVFGIGAVVSNEFNRTCVAVDGADQAVDAAQC
jgi:pilus assembly protein Flp/PilA